MLDSFGSLFLLLGPIVIIMIGVLVTIIFTSLWRDVKRWVVLFIVPLLTLLVAFGATYLVTEFINPAEGSGFLLGGTAMALFFMTLVAYYPILIIMAIVHFIKKKKSTPTHI